MRMSRTDFHVDSYGYEVIGMSNRKFRPALCDNWVDCRAPTERWITHSSLPPTMPNIARIMCMMASHIEPPYLHNCCCCWSHRSASRRHCFWPVLFRSVRPPFSYGATCARILRLLSVLKHWRGGPRSAAGPRAGVIHASHATAI